MLLKNTSVRETLSMIASARRQLAFQMDPSSAQKFGKERGQLEPGTFFRSPIGPLLVPSVNQSGLMVRDEFVARILQKYPSWEKAPRAEKYQFRVQIIAVNLYTFRSGKEVEASEIVRSDKQSEMLLVVHPEFRTAQMIFEDAIGRLEELRQKPQVEEFLKAMFGFYNATIYERGTAAIGRVFFDAYFRFLFNRPHQTLPDGVDIEAMISEVDEFINKMRPYFLS